MSILIALIWALIWCAVILLLAYVIIWAIGQLIPGMPARVTQILWVIAVLCVVLVLVGVFLGALPSPPHVIGVPR